MSHKIKWMEMTPVELDEAVARRPIAYLPIGSLEWHGPHLPLGTDSYRAEAICLGAAEKSGGVVLPTMYITAPGFSAYRGSIFFSGRLVEQIMDEIEREIEKVGFRVLIKLLGHGGQAQNYCFRDEGRKRPASRRLKTLMTTGHFPTARELGLTGPHAGAFETAQTFATAPDAVQLDKYDPAATTLPRYEGLDPATYYDGLPEEMRERVRTHMARTEWEWQDDLVERVTAEGAAPASLQRAAEHVARQALDALTESGA